MASKDWAPRGTALGGSLTPQSIHSQESLSFTNTRFYFCVCGPFLCCRVQEPIYFTGDLDLALDEPPSSKSLTCIYMWEA